MSEQFDVTEVINSCWKWTGNPTPQCANFFVQRNEGTGEIVIIIDKNPAKHFLAYEVLKTTLRFYTRADENSNRKKVRVKVYEDENVTSTEEILKELNFNFIEKNTLDEMYSLKTEKVYEFLF